LTDQANFWHWLTDALEQEVAVMLMIVVSSTGSSPGKAGAKMAMTIRDKHYGTIGGGAVEYAMVKHALALLAQEPTAPELCLQRHALSGRGQASGMICGGEQTILLYRCRNSDRELCRQLAESFLNHSQVVLQLTPAGFLLNPQQIPPGPIEFNRFSDTDWSYQETAGVYKQAYLIGGGHVSLALSRILATLDFDITVIDERPNLDTLNRNTDACRKLNIPYREIQQAVPNGDQVFILIMTHSHKTDEQVAELLAHI
jgi:xanthine dehydrogenase accessory factor